MHCSGSSVDYIIHEKPPLFRTWNLLRLQKDKKEIRRKDKTTENSITNRQIVHRSFLILEKVHNSEKKYRIIILKKKEKRVKLVLDYYHTG